MQGTVSLDVKANVAHDLTHTLRCTNGLETITVQRFLVGAHGNYMQLSHMVLGSHCPTVHFQPGSNDECHQLVQQA